MLLGKQTKSIYIFIVITPKSIKNILNLLKCITMEGKFGIKVRMGVSVSKIRKEHYINCLKFKEINM